MMAANSNGPERGAFKKKGEKGRKNTKFRTNRANNNNRGKKYSECLVLYSLLKAQEVPGTEA